MSNHVEFKHPEKKNKIHPHGDTIGKDEETNLDKENNNKKTGNDSHEKAKSLKGVANAIRRMSTVKTLWRRHVSRKGESEARDGPAGRGLGLCEFDKTDLKRRKGEEVAEATCKLHGYFKELDDKQKSEKENSNQVRMNFDQVEKENSNQVRVNFDQIEEYFNSGARVDWPDKQGQILFHEAARAWSVDVAKYLLSKAATIPDTSDDSGQTLLNTPDNYGRTPLHVAAIVNNVKVAKWLLDNGAKKDARTEEEKQTPVHYAAKYDSYHVMKTLIKAECEYKEVRDYKRRTPLQLAAENGISHMVSLLLELNAPVNVKDDQGQLAIILIMKNTRSLAREAMDQFIKRDSIRRQQTVYMNYMVPIENPDERSFAQSPLEVITTNRYYDLVTHDIIKAIISIKWKHFGKCGAVGNLILDFLFIVVWTVLGVYPDWTIRYKYNFPHDAWRVCLWVVAVTLTIYEIVSEVIEYRKSKSKLNNWKEWKKKQLDRDLKLCHPQWPDERTFLEKKKRNIKSEEMVYLKDWWNVLDWICYCLLTICIATHLTDALLSVHSVALARAHIRIMVVTLILVWLRLMKSARAFAALGPFIVILGQMINDFAKFIFLYVVFYIPYLAAFWMIFGGVRVKDEYVENPPTDNTSLHSTTLVIPGYDSVHKLLFSLFRLTLVDEYPYEDMNEVDPIMSDLLVATWFALSTILCINLFIALLSDTFQRVYDNAQANGLMLKAITIMEIEGNLPKKQLKKHIDDIHKKTEPEDYVEDVSKGESDLKKVAFQVKQELEEMKEWFSDKFEPDLGDDTHKQTVPKKKLRRGGSQQDELGLLRGEMQEIKQDMASQMRDVASLKGMLQELVGKQRRGGRRGDDGNESGAPIDVPATGIGSDVPAGRDVPGGFDDVDNAIPYTRSISLIPLYDEDEYAIMDMERRHASRRRKKKKKKRSRHFEFDDIEDARGLAIHRTSPTVEVDSLGFMEPPPQQIAQLRATPEPELPDSTEA